MVDSFLSRSGLSLDDIGCYITHPGGKKVLAAYEEALSLNKGALDHSPCHPPLLWKYVLSNSPLRVKSGIEDSP